LLHRAADAACCDGARGMKAMASYAASLDGRLVRACLHEAAHAVAARSLGYAVDIEIDRVNIGAGRVLAYGMSSWADQRIYGLAGPIATEQSENGTNASAGSIAHTLRRPGAMSPQDERLVGIVDFWHVSAAVAMVRSKWDEITAESRRLLAIELAAHGFAQ
jgi:hypothetical protein